MTKFTEYKLSPLFNEIKIPMTSLYPDRLRSLYELAILSKFIDGDVVECGVFAGSSASLLAQTIYPKKLHLFDTFTGLPALMPEDGNALPAGSFACTLDVVQENLILLDNVVYNVGDIKDTLNSYINCRFSLVHLDLDRYQSYKTALDFFLGRTNGIIVCDDYAVGDCEGATKAIDEFLKCNSITEVEYKECQIIIKCYSQKFS